MSYFPGLKLTKAGEQLLAKVNGNLNETINFKRAELGSGVINTDDEIRFLTMLKEKWKDVKISECKIVGTDKTQVQIELQFDNADISSNKIFRELGIYAATNDDEEILFAYSNAKENFDYIPAVTDNPQSFVINILITITSNTKVDAQIDLNSYVTLRKLQEELDKKLDKGAVSTEYDTAKKIEDKIENLIKTKEPSITKNTAFNKDFGTSEDEVLEGAKLAETLGIPYGGILNNSNTKTEGTAYYDSTTKKTYKCTVTNTLNYADASKYEAISNNDLLLKFQNLSKDLYIDYYDKKIFSANTIYFATKNYYLYIRGYSGGTLEISSDKNMSNILFNSGKIGGTTSIFSCLIPKGYYFRVANASDFSCIGFEYFF